MSMDSSLSMQISLTISGRNLPNKDYFSKSDPYTQVFILGKDKKWLLLGRTETIMNSLNPQFTKEFLIPYHFEEEQVLLLRLYDDDFGNGKDDYLGEVTFKVGTLMGSRGQVLVLPLAVNGVLHKKATVTVRADQADDGGSGDILHLTLCGKSLDRKDGFFSKSDPYFVISTSSDGVEWFDVYKSEYIKQNLNPKWNTAAIPFRRLRGKKLKLEVTDWDLVGAHDLIGIAYISVEDLFNKRKDIPLIHPPTKSKYKKSSYRNSGLVDVVDCRLEKNPTMIDYLRGGLQMNMMVAIDFTGSNGDPRDAGTLHYGGGQYPNNYIRAIQAVGDIVVEYDSDKMIPAFGFGARLSATGSVSHCFPLTGTPAQEQVYGIPGVLQAYASCFQRGILLSGPTYFAQIIRRCAALARQNFNTYSVLLLITDGVLNDIQETIDAICEASDAPLSIIIVGVGNADFSTMRVLDADITPLVSSRGVLCDRDIVQFVPYNEIVRSGDPSLLAKETLEEVPMQLVQYFKTRSILPSPPVIVTEDEIATGPLSGTVVSAPSQTQATSQSSEVGRIGRDLFSQAVSF